MKSFLCGRLMQTNDGILKKIDLEDGGGTRRCHLEQNGLLFETVKKRLMKIYHLNNYKCKVSLYDFKLEPLNVDKYENFSQYINEYGLNCRSIVVYLCTHEVNDDNDDDDDDDPIILPENKNQVELRTLTHEQESSPLQQTNTSSTTMFENKSMVINEQISSQCSDEFSFMYAIRIMMENIRNVLKEKTIDDIVVKLFENLCLLNGLTYSIIDPLQQKIKMLNDDMEFENQNDSSIHENNLEHALDLCRQTKNILKSNKNKYNHIQSFAETVNLFTGFYRNLKQLLRMAQKNPNQCDESSALSLTQENDSILQHQSISSFLTTTDQLTKDKLVPFQLVLQCLNSLLCLLYPQYLSKFREFIDNVMGEIQCVQSTINFDNEKSLEEARRKIKEIEKNINTVIAKENISYSKAGVDGQLNILCNKTRKAIHILLISLNYHRLQLEQSNRLEHPNWSSPPRPYVDEN